KKPPSPTRDAPSRAPYRPTSSSKTQHLHRPHRARARATQPTPSQQRQPAKPTASKSPQPTRPNTNPLKRISARCVDPKLHRPALPPSTFSAPPFSKISSPPRPKPFPSSTPSPA